jgi:uncharacterized protein YndB with AHSA1/START domain
VTQWSHVKSAGLFRAATSPYDGSVARVTNRITIQRPIEDVFAVLTDVEQTATWFPGDVEEHWTSPPPHGVGSTRHAVVTMFGRRTENDAVTTEYDPPYRAAIRGTTPNAPFEAGLTFARDGDGTHVEVTSEFFLTGWTRPMGALVAAAYGWAWGRGLKNLKAMMESAER